MDVGEDHGLAPARIKRQLESSLRRLGVERVPMYLTHDWDPDVPIAETAGALDELVTAGKIGAYGLSNVDGSKLRDALAAGRFGWVQNSYSLLDRSAEDEVLPLCEEHGLGFTPFSPLAGGWLTGKYRRGEPPPAGSRMTMRPEPYEHLREDGVFDRLERLEELGDPATLAFAWLLTDPRVTAVVVGPRRPQHLEPAFAALAIAPDRTRVTALSPELLSPRAGDSSACDVPGGLALDRFGITRRTHVSEEANRSPGGMYAYAYASSAARPCSRLARLRGGGLRRGREVAGSTTTSGGAAASGGTLRMAIGSEPPSLDPGLATDTTSAFVVLNTNTPIVYLGKAPDLKPVPALAKSWDVAGKNITLHLRSDVKWTDGTTVKASDVVWSWLRTISPQLGADYAYQFYGISGAQEYNSCKPSAANQQCGALKDKVAISAPDATTVKIELTSPQPWFMQQLSHTSFIPVNQAAVDKWGEKWTEPGHNVSDGPFTLTQWKHDASLRLVKNPDWYSASEVKLDKVDLKIITEGATAEQAFNAGDVDVNETGWPPSDTPQIKSTSAYQQFPSLGIYYYGFNVKKITDVNQRKAMALAIDRQAIVEHITQTGQVPATAFSPEGIPGAKTINSESTLLGPTADMDKAQQYMDKVANPVKDVNLIFNNAPGHKEIAIAIQANWKKLGLNVRSSSRTGRSS